MEYLYISIKYLIVLFNYFFNLIPLNFQKPIFTFKFQYWQIQNKNIQGLIVNKKKLLAHACSSYCSSQTHRQMRLMLLLVYCVVCLYEIQ